ncbi:hypothetical protein [Lysinibacillus xylanilyticus]|uniref:hypothetical protein n=1 Tax=Lysinibacillus xylanilyticus TaxID=582475 RepID=UPI003CFD2DCB
MAKLNVEVLDMANGEITKVAYEGAEYAKVDGLVKSTEDILLAIENGYDRTKGEFYRVISVGSTVRWEDNTSANGVGAEYIGDRFEVFRKISADKPTLEKRVEALESDVAALKLDDSSLKGEKESPITFKVGDTVKVVRSTASWGSKEKAGYHVGGQGVVKIGAIGEVTSVSGDFVTVKFAFGDVNGGCQHKRKLRFDEIELAEETIEYEGATYRKVEREAREGDVVILKDTGGGLFKVGKKYKVVKGVQIADDDNDLFDLYRSKLRRTRETVDVYEPIEQAKYVPQEGDIVVITGNTSVHANKIGDIGKVGKGEPLGDGGVNVYVPEGPTNAIRTKPQDIRKASPAEVEKYEQAVKDANKPKLKAGDFVKITRKRPYYDNGKIYEVRKDNDGDLYVIDEVGDAVYGAISNGEYEIVDAETAKWAKFGRKPNEFKIGDIVELTGSHLGHPIGTIGEVVKAPSHFIGTDIGVKANGHVKSHLGQMKLLAPVESLFNA